MSPRPQHAPCIACRAAPVREPSTRREPESVSDMRITRYLAVALMLAVPAAARAQRPDSTARARAIADSLAAATRDSIALMKALGAAMADTTSPPATPVGPAGRRDQSPPAARLQRRRRPRRRPVAEGQHAGRPEPLRHSRGGAGRAGRRRSLLPRRHLPRHQRRRSRSRSSRRTSPPRRCPTSSSSSSAASSCRSASRTRRTGTTCTPSSTRGSSRRFFVRRGAQGHRPAGQPRLRPLRLLPGAAAHRGGPRGRAGRGPRDGGAGEQVAGRAWASRRASATTST